VLFPFAGGSIVGGSHVSALGLAAALDPGRYEPLVLLHSSAGKVGELTRSFGLDYRLMENVPLMAADQTRDGQQTGLLGYLFGSLSPLVAELKASGCQIVHTNDGRMHGNWALATKLARRKLVWHQRGDPNGKAVNLIAPVLADHIVSVSEFSRPAKPLWSIGHKFSVVRSPFEFASPPPTHEAGRTAILQQLSLPENALLLGYFGSLTTRKRPSHFVRAVHRIAAALPDRSVHGLLYGAPENPAQGLDAECLDLARSLGLQDNIHLMGYQRPIEQFIAGVDFVLVTALGEPFGRTLIEAMYLGTPVIATRHGGNIEAIRDGLNGVLVDPDDPAAFVAPVLRLSSDPGARAAMVEAARTYALANFGTARHAALVMGIYDRVLGTDHAVEAQNATT
jgi:glycosyltransferase involved in cell wall biosynthesis